MTVGAAAIEFIMGLHWYSWCIVVGTAMCFVWAAAAFPILAFPGTEMSRAGWAWLLAGCCLLAVGILNMPAL